MSIAIIGGGAAGMMCAATLIDANYSGEILLFEKNDSLGQKVAITGGGRCNVTTGLRNHTALMSKYIRGADFLNYAMRKFGPQAMEQRCEAHDLPLKTEADNRVFPISNESQDVIKMFSDIITQAPNCTVYTSTAIETVKKTSDGFLLQTKDGDFTSQNLIITTGGNAYPQTGSTGDAYTRMKNFGHQITPLGPSLSSLVTQESRIHDCSGLHFPQAKVSYHLHGQTKYRSGPLLCTHFGLSGPLIFAVSADLAHEHISQEIPVELKLQVDTERDYQYRHQALLTFAQTHKNKQIKTLLAEQFPKRFVEAIDAAVFNHTLETPANSFTKDQRKELCHFLSGQLKATVVERRPGDEFVTAGGVATHQIDPKTMQSTIVPGLYLAGEVLDIDGLTGGFNLQAAWATGRLAGVSLS